MAAHAGVSPATVSRYFNHPHIVRYETRNRILAAATELGYVRNRAAGSLNRGRTGTVGLVIPTVDNAIFAELIEEFASTLSKFEHALLISSHGYDLTREAQQVQILLEHQIDGIVLVGGEHSEETFHLISSNELPALTVWNWSKNARLPCIGIENRELGRMSAWFLYDLGHRDIACLFPDGSGNDRADDRRNGAFSVLARLGAGVALNRHIACPYDVDLAKDIARDVMQGVRRPSAILAGNDIIAQAAIYAAASLGLRVPHDISIMGIGDFRGSAALEPGLTTLRIPARDIATHAARTIVDLISDDDPDLVSSLRLRPELSVRSSTARKLR